MRDTRPAWFAYSEAPGPIASERSVHVYDAKPSADFPESVRNIQLGITSLKRVVRLIPGVVKNSIIIQV